MPGQGGGGRLTRLSSARQNHQAEQRADHHAHSTLGRAARRRDRAGAASQWPHQRRDLPAAGDPGHRLLIDSGHKRAGRPKWRQYGAAMAGKVGPARGSLQCFFSLGVTLNCSFLQLNHCQGHGRSCTVPLSRAMRTQRPFISILRMTCSAATWLPPSRCALSR